MSHRVYLFKGFERFWHWSQAALIVFMLASGFEIHGTWRLFGFARAVQWHGWAAWTLIGLWAFAIFWHFVTGEWRQYLPTGERIAAMARFYAVGIFRGEPHPFRPTPLAKHNPLQRLAYLGVLLLIGPLLWVSGGLLLFHGDWAVWRLATLTLAGVATAHTAGAFLMLAFLIAHLYLITTGETPGAQLKTMVTGWEEAA